MWPLGRKCPNSGDRSIRCWAAMSPPPTRSFRKWTHSICSESSGLTLNVRSFAELWSVKETKMWMLPIHSASSGSTCNSMPSRRKSHKWASLAATWTGHRHSKCCLHTGPCKWCRIHSGRRVCTGHSGSSFPCLRLGTTCWCTIGLRPAPAEWSAHSTGRTRFPSSSVPHSWGKESIEFAKFPHVPTWGQACCCSWALYTRICERNESGSAVIITDPS